MESSQVRRLIEFNKDEIKLYLLTSLQEETVYIKEAAHRSGIKHVNSSSHFKLTRRLCTYNCALNQH